MATSYLTLEHEFLTRCPPMSYVKPAYISVRPIVYQFVLNKWLPIELNVLFYVNN
jgi:hypothetical protein